MRLRLYLDPPHLHRVFWDLLGWHLFPSYWRCHLFNIMLPQFLVINTVTCVELVLADRIMNRILTRRRATLEIRPSERFWKADNYRLGLIVHCLLELEFRQGMSAFGLRRITSQVVMMPWLLLSAVAIHLAYFCIGATTFRWEDFEVFVWEARAVAWAGNLAVHVLWVGGGCDITE